MFDFSEWVILALVALIVIGPERLPRVARTAGLLFGRAQRYVNELKADVARQVELEDLQRARAEAEQAVRGVGEAVARETSAARDTVQSLAADAAAPPAAANGAAGESNPPPRA